MVDSPDTDQQLVDRVKQGDKRAYDMLVIKYQHRILGLVGGYVSDFQEVQDVTQEAFIKAYRALDKFRGDSSFYTWLYRIAVNTAKNHLVSKGRRLPESDIDVHDADFLETATTLRVVDTPERNLYCNEIEQVIHDVIQRLPDELRTAVMLREFDGLSYEEIADVMDCPVGTVRSRIFRAREAIDREIRPLLGQSG
ncbi:MULTISPECIES: RNA polymerase sigma factor RpoE [Gammaproteobacteria]|uniref:RNA polymerase sigma factor RpoE n=1 Tax=Gammaproteobacteria TaxID=1236 RepID=UPI001AD9C218|nr:MULTISPECIES: RNA polymerase sigma factor RpoE [Gammaproteobacteria]MBO9479869.1 RNA polymerase sigma factor RpoE [Salinisphaera sp. G21_0]MBO9492633.1 RNA polymerase sigma factor RpoE [Thalassotalea sp. G20_0]